MSEAPREMFLRAKPVSEVLAARRAEAPCGRRILPASADRACSARRSWTRRAPTSRRAGAEPGRVSGQIDPALAKRIPCSGRRANISRREGIDVIRRQDASKDLQRSLLANKAKSSAVRAREQRKMPIATLTLDVQQALRWSGAPGHDTARRATTLRAWSIRCALGQGAARRVTTLRAGSTRCALGQGAQRPAHWAQMLIFVDEI